MNIQSIPRVALYLRSASSPQAGPDPAIMDQQSRGEAWCSAHGYELAGTFADPGISGLCDRRAGLQRLMTAASAKPAPFDVVAVGSASRFSRDPLQFAQYSRDLAENGVRLIAIADDDTLSETPGKEARP